MSRCTVLILILVLATDSRAEGPDGRQTLEVVPLFTGSVEGGLQDMHRRLLKADTAQTLEEVWGPGDSTPSCEPDSRFVIVFALRSSRRERFAVNISRRYRTDDPWKLRKIRPRSTGTAVVSYRQVRLSDGVSGPVYYTIRNARDARPTGVLQILHGGEILFEKRVEYRCPDGPGAGIETATER